MRAEVGVAEVPATPVAPSRRRILLTRLGTGVIWLAGSAVVVVAQPDHDRRLAAVAAAAAGVATILVVSLLTADRGRRYLRSTIGTVVAVSLTTNWMLWHLGATSSNFAIAGLVERIVLPLLVVLLAPLVAVAALGHQGLQPQALWAQRRSVVHAAHPMDWLVAAYASVVLLPALLLGLAHHDRPLYIAQDLGLIVFFAFMYLVGRLSTVEAARALSGEVVGLLLLLTASDIILFSWQIAPLYSFTEAACAAALAVLVLRPRTSQVLPVGLAIVLLAEDAVQIKHGTGASAAVELAGAVGVVAYLLLRKYRLVSLWILVPVTVLALAVFLGFTSDGAALRGVYHGPDPSNTGRTFEAHQVRAAVADSPVSLVFGRGLGSTIDETHAARQFRQTLVYGGRDLAHVQEVHLMGFSFLLKTGFLGLLWLAAFAFGLVVLAFSGLERAVRERDAGLVLYVALPLLGFAQALAATTHLQANPLNALGLGLLVACLNVSRASAPPAPGRRKRVLAVAVCTLVAGAIVVYVGASRTSAQPAAAPTPISLWIGDSYTAGAGAASAVSGEAFGVADALGWQIELDAGGGTGFVAGHPKSRHDKPLPDRLRCDAARYPASVVVIDAGRNDAGRPWPKVRRAAASYFSALAKAYPWSAIVVVAPWEMKSKPNSYLRIRQFLARQAKRRHWAFVDPIADGWVNRTSAKLVVRDGVHPNQLGYNYLISHLDLDVEQALFHAHETVRINCTEAEPCRRGASKSR